MFCAMHGKYWKVLNDGIKMTENRFVNGFGIMIYLTDSPSRNNLSETVTSDCMFKLNDEYMRQESKPSLTHTMACHL